jgi:hypothetical protein
MWSLPRSYLEDKRSDQVSSVRESGKRTCTCDAEESPLLEAVAREWLVKTKQTGKGIAHAAVNFGDQQWHCNCL